jgi:hypothetical protein
VRRRLGEVLHDAGTANWTFRSATFDTVEVSLWVNRVISGPASDFRFSPESDQTAALRQVSLGPDPLIGS